jgi:hypothetical protein
MDTDDLYPTELELIYSSLTVLMCEEKDVEKRIAVNNDDIKNRVKDIVIPMYDVSAYPTSDVEHEHQHQHQHPHFETESTSDPETPSEAEPEPEPEHTSTSESSPIVKKLFKQIALLCHPDKVKDEKRNRLFIHARSAHDRNDVLTLLFIMSKCGPSAVLETSEIAAVKELLEERRKEVLNKKDTVCYKWDTYTTQIKDILIQQIIGAKR